MGKVIYPFGDMPVETIEETTTNVYNHTVSQDEIINIKGTALSADATLNLTAGTGLRPGAKLVVWWLSNVGARDITIKPLLGTNGEKYDGTASKYSTVTIIYDGSKFIPLSYLASISI